MKLIAYILLLPFAFHSAHAHSQTASNPISSPISECPGRSVSQVRRGALEFELSVLFYYVSWSSEARLARLVYNAVANYYHDYAYFGAVDCWHLQCNCSRTFGPIPAGAGGYPNKYPTLIVRYGRNMMIDYQGAWHFDDLSRFMNNLIQPLDRIHSSGELSELRKIADAVVLALVSSADDQAYRRFRSAAVRWLELDPERNIRFTVTFGQSARQMLKEQNSVLPQLVLIDSRNGVHFYNTTTNDWTSMDILRWVRSSLKSFSLISNGYGNPMTIAAKARHMPVLAMGIKMHHQQQQSAMPLVMGEEQAIVQKKQQEDCDRLWSEEDESREEQAIDPLQWPSVSWQLNGTTLANYYEINRYLDRLWLHYSHQNVEPKATQPVHLMALHSRNRCLAHTQHGTPSLKISIAKMVTKYGHLIWQHSAENPPQNRSLGVVLFDSIKYKDYLQQLGIIQNHQSPHALVQVFILDLAEEALHVMPQHHHQAFSYVALKDFIRQFYARTLPRIHKNSLLPPNSLFVSNYNRQLLLQALQRPNATQVVFMQRPDCGLSAVLSQAFLQVSALLKSPDLHFIRFDSQANDLPWELSMPETPALIVFPQSNPAESVVFPTDVRVDVQNVFAFILAQLEPEQQLRMVLSSCRRRMRHVRSCLDFARSLVFQHVSQYLKYWEIYEKERDLILSHLKEFNELHIAIESSIRL
ncbi:uncharacterized protein Dwil_GK17192 [Drosophila willistoni]|uniref:Thioredoxin domain-containing protein n=1 Tax=Drosophila willistoni TaxID=7260 RepID=B4MKS5_DROWI|nr:uncharacterized protein LOC6639333 [Drosophila willistoni]EDW72781.1 uncharacterized protein Dwil_GK17192 [Drosophila willistoni]